MQPTNYESYLSQNPSPAPTPGGGSSNWLTNLLPTAGSVLGGIGGAFVPVLGETGVGEVAGASAGSAAGKALQNMLEGKSTSAGDLGTSALEGGIGQLTGMGIGKVAGGLLGKVGDFAGGRVAQAADKAALAPYEGISHPDLVPTLERMRGLGVDVSDPNNLIKAARAVTLEDGAINGIKNQLIQAGGATPVDLDKAVKAANDVASASNVKTPSYLIGQIRSLGGDLNNLADPAKTFDVIKNIERKGANVGGPNGDVLRQAYRQAAMALKDDLFNSQGANAAVAAYKATPEDITAITNAAGGNKALADYMINAVNNGKSIPDLRAAEHPFAIANDIGEAAINKMNSKLPTPESAIGNQMGLTPADAILGAVAHAHPVAATAAGASRIAKVIPPELLQNAAGSAARLANSKAIPAGTQLLAHAGDFGNGNLGATTMMNTTAQPTTAGTTGTTGQGYDPNQLAEYLIQAIQVNPYAASSLAPILAQVMQPLQQANKAQASLGALQDTYQAAGGGQGMLPGILSEIAALVPGTAANQYNAQRGATQQQLSAAGVPAALPSLMAGGGTASTGFSNAQSILQSLGNPNSFQGSPVLSGIR